MKLCIYYHYLYSCFILTHHGWTTWLTAFTARMIVLIIDYAVEIKAKLRLHQKSSEDSLCVGSPATEFSTFNVGKSFLD